MDNTWLNDPDKRTRNLGKEVAVRYHASEINSKGTFYTDSNGREMILRRRNKRGNSYPKFRTNEPVAGNYYPVNAMIAVENEELDSAEETQLCVIPDKAERLCMMARWSSWYIDECLKTTIEVSKNH